MSYKCVCGALIMLEGLTKCPVCNYPNLQARRVGFTKYETKKPEKKIVVLEECDR